MIFATKKAPITIQDVCMQPNPQRINAWVRSCSISDLWQQLRLIPNRQALFLFSLLPHREQKEVFLCMDRIDQNTFYFALSPEQRKSLMDWIPMDEIVDFYQSLLVGEKDEFLSSIEPARQAELLRLAQYPEGSIGAVMTTEFFTISSNATIGEVMDLYADRVMREKELGQFGYVVFDNGHLLGCLDLTKLATYPAEDSVQKWMHLSPVCIAVEASLREVIALSHRQHAKEIAVVDRSFAMIGLLTHDDLLRIEQRELARSLVTFGGSSLRGSDLDILRSPIRKILSVRLYWLVVLTVFGMVTSAIVANQTRLLEHAIILAAFIAPIVDMGGNVGSQSATLVIRAMSLGDVSTSWCDIARIIERECWTAAVLGIVIGALEGILAYLGKGVGGEVLMVVILSMAICTFLGGVIGALLPFAARRLGTDPATLSSPLITSIMDMLGVVIYFSLAWLFLHDTLVGAL